MPGRAPSEAGVLLSRCLNCGHRWRRERFACTRCGCEETVFERCLEPALVYAVTSVGDRVLSILEVEGCRFLAIGAPSEMPVGARVMVCESEGAPPRVELLAGGAR